MLKTKKLIYPILILSIFLLSAYFRFYNLGYSDFQGDEVSAQDHMFTGKTFSKYLITQVKPPGQFFITKIIHKIGYFGFREELVMRIPFAFVSLLAVILFYVGIKKLKNKELALISTAFLGLNGLIIAFGRIVQYQSFVLLFGILAIFSLYLYFKHGRYLYLVISALSSAIGLLFHYDSIVFIIPIALFLLIRKKIKPLILFSAITTIIASAYYIPFLLGPNLTETYKYIIRDRISGSTFIFDQAYYTYILIRTYIPKEYLITLFGGLFVWIYNQFDKKYSGVTLVITLLVTTYLRINSGIYNQQLMLANLIIVTIGSILIFNKLKKDKDDLTILMFLWFLTGFLLYTFFIRKTLTHFYIYLPPLIFLSSQAFYNTFKKSNKSVKILTTVLASIIVISSISYNYQGLIENKKEFPFENESYIFGQMYTLTPKGKNVDGLFGFPHYYNWRDIAQDLLKFSEQYKVYIFASNEKSSLYGYYISKLHPHEYDKLKNLDKKYLFVNIKGPIKPWMDYFPEGEVLLSNDKYEIILVN